MATLICTNCQAENLSNSKYCSRCGHALEAPVQSSENLPPLPLPVSSSANKRKNVIAALVGVAFVILVGCGIFYFKGHNFIYSRVIEKSVEEINKSCPMKVDEITQIDNVEIIDENTVQFNYSISGLKSQIDPLAFTTRMQPAIIQSVRTNKELMIFRLNKTTLIYNYKDNTGEVIYRLTITPEMYAENN